MLMTFTTRTPAVKTEEQKKISKLAWAPNKAAAKRQKSGPCVVVYKRPEQA
jgi:hypothetical protein